MTRKEILKQAVIPALARPGDPLVLANGTQVRPAKRKKAERRSDIDAENFKASKRRTLKELPAIPVVVNGCAVVLMYTIMGLGDREIAQAAGITHEQVAQVRQHSAYAECFNILKDEFINANSELLAARIAAYSHDAVDKIHQLSQGGQHEATQLRASTHIHDHAVGVKGKDNGGGINVNELRIFITEGEREPARVQLNGEEFQ